MNQKKTALCISIITLLLVLSFSGCINQFEKESEDKLQISLEKINADLVLHPDSYQNIPIIAPLVIDRKINLEINESGIIIEDISLFSSRVAITFWNKSEEVIVVDSYKNALLASSLALMLKVPLLLYSESTQYVINALEVKHVITVGKLQIPGSFNIADEFELYKYEIEVAKERNIQINYLVLVNTNPNSYLSPVGTLLAAYRNGLVINVSDTQFKTGVVDYNKSSNLSTRLTEIYSLLDGYNIPIKYVCIVGTPFDVPYIKMFVLGSFDKSGDAFYGFKDRYKEPAMKFAPPLIVGRFMTRDMVDAMSLFNRIVNYNQYLGNETMGWQNQALIISYEDITVESFTLYSQLVAFKNMLLDGKFITIMPPTPIERSLIQKMFEDKNFIFDICVLETQTINPEGWNMSSGVLYSLLLSPDVKGTKDRMEYVMSLFKSGLVSVVAPINVPVVALKGYWPGDNISDGLDAGMNWIGRVFFEELITKNVSVGEAFWNAKQRYLTIWGAWDAPRIESVYDLALYGDPAFNPYEPCNEGKSN